MAFTSRVTWDIRRSIDSSTLTGSYQVLGTPLLYPPYKIKMVNNSSVLVDVSIDGVNAHDVSPAGSFWLYDETQTGKYEMLSAGSQIYVKGSAGTGLIYLVVQYIIHA